MAKFESAIIFDIARKKLPAGRLQNIFSRSKRLLDYWAARGVNESRRNPLDRLRLLLEELDLHGYGDYARAAIDYLAEPLDGRFAPNKPARSDKGTVAGEVMDATICLGDLAGIISQAMDDGKITGEERIEIDGAARRLIAEVDQILDVVENKGKEA